MSDFKERPPLILLHGRQASDSVLSGTPPTTERERRDTRLDRKARRRQVKDRALSRFGLEIGRMARQTMIQRVQKGDVRYARKLTNSRTVIVLDYAGSEVAFLYSSSTKEIVSFLPPDTPVIAAWRGSQTPLTPLRRGPEEAPE
jgi:hypothetical protein